LKPCVFVNILSGLHKEKEREKISAWRERGGEELPKRNTYPVGSTPEREKRQELERRVQGKREGEEEEAEGKHLTFHSQQRVLIHKEE